jgi:hypothetical protein
MYEIHTAVVNNPEFIEFQYLTLKKYIKEDYKFVVFNDAKEFPDYSNNNDTTLKYKIRKTCERLNIECVNIPNSFHKTQIKASDRTAYAMNFMLHKNHISTKNQILVLDSDMFPIAPFSFERYGNIDLAIVPQYRGKDKYFWNGIYYFNMETIKNRELLNWWVKTPDNKFQADTGAAMRDFLLLPGNKFYEIKNLSSCNWQECNYPDSLDTIWLEEFYKKDPRNNNGNFFAELYDGTFFHYRAGGNWDKIGFQIHEQRINLLKNIIYNILKLS